MHAEKRRGRARSRILYWFRTPPGVKVGRAALDEDAIRMIEEHNPDIDFDWTRILKGGGEPTPERERRAEPRPEPRPARLERATPPQAVEVEAAEAEPVGEMPEPEVPALLSDEPQTAAHMRLGSEGLSRLRGRYAEMMARISERIPDAERQAELKTIAERLNPDAWVTEEEVTAGLDGYETAFESLRGVVGQRRRRRRRKSQAE